jgi:hypothetical protein
MILARMCQVFGLGFAYWIVGIWVGGGCGGGGCHSQPFGRGPQKSIPRSHHCLSTKQGVRPLQVIGEELLPQRRLRWETVPLAFFVSPPEQPGH